MSDDLNEQIARYLIKRGRLHVNDSGCPEEGPSDPRPDWAHSLDACAELRKGLTDEQQSGYLAALASQFKDVPEWVAGENPYWLLINATPEQHCRAFLAATEGKA